MIDNYSCELTKPNLPFFLPSPSVVVLKPQISSSSCSWDTRGNSGSAVKPTSRVQAHDAEINAIAFAPHNENILITGSADKVR